MSFRLGGEWGQSPWQRVGEQIVVTIAVLRAVLALGITVFLIKESSLPAIDATNIRITTPLNLAFFLAGIFLYKKGFGDLRARLFGCTFLLIASVYSQLPYPLVSNYLPKSLWPLLAVIAGLRPDTFLAYFFWIVVAEFPSSTASPVLRRVVRIGQAAALFLGCWYFLLGALRIVIRLADNNFGVVTDALSISFFSLWSVCLPIAALAFPIFIFKRHQLRKIERRRASLFLASFCCFLALPLILSIINTQVDQTFDLVTRPSDFRYLIGNILLILFPFATIYTVLSHRVLDVESVARSAFRYMFAKYSVTFLGLVPFGYLIYFGWLNRNSTLTEIFAGNEASLLVGASIVGLTVAFYRQTLLDLIDRRFFRERYDSRRVLTELIEQVRGTRTVDELAKLVERGVDLALHLQRVALLVENPSRGRFLDPQHQLRPLDVGSPLVTLVAGSRDPLAVDLDSPRSPFLSLPQEEKSWLADHKVEMIAPICALDGALIGLLALGAKRSELPFLHEDRELLAGVASSAGLVIEVLRLKETISPAATPAAAAEAATPGEPVEAAAAADKNALECIACDRIYPPGTGECPNCHVDLEKTNIPYIFRDLYRFDFRLGAGGMAVVYRGKDLKLGRPVAIKTLPKVTAEAAMRLRREARTAASVSHPGLASIYGLETWRGVPMIITELLAGGTLADQLGKSPLAPLEAIDMARTVALALAKIHAVGILHRDIKPSNIGYTEDGDVKLLDFGIARILHDFRQEKPDTESALAPDGRSRIVNTASVMLPRTKTGQLVGTVTYLSPEAARGEKPDPSVDLWALAVCVYEALTAENLFFGRNFEEVLGQIRDLKIADVRRKVPACPEPLALFLRQELDLDRSKRAEDGLELASRLGQVRAKILAA